MTEPTEGPHVDAEGAVCARHASHLAAHARDAAEPDVATLAAAVASLAQAVEHVAADAARARHVADQGARLAGALGDVDVPPWAANMIGVDPAKIAAAATNGS